jgi:hypothetical protein
MIDSKTWRVTWLINRSRRSLVHVINSLLLTVKRDSIIDYKTRILIIDYKMRLNVIPEASGKITYSIVSGKTRRVTRCLQYCVICITRVTYIVVSHVYICIFSITTSHMFQCFFFVFLWRLTLDVCVKRKNILCGWLLGLSLHPTSTILQHKTVGTP